MRCLHNKAFNFLQLHTDLFFGSKMALSTFWVVDPCPRGIQGSLFIFSTTQMIEFEFTDDLGLIIHKLEWRTPPLCRDTDDIVLTEHCLFCFVWGPANTYNIHKFCYLSM